MAHTPGPWSIQYQRGLKADAYRIMARNGEWTVCLGPNWHAEHAIENLANADLIAAAPEMVAERDRLKALVAELAGALDATLRLIRRTQDRLSMHLQPDSCGDDGEVLNELLTMFDGPEQRAIEKPARAVLARAKEIW